MPGAWIGTTKSAQKASQHSSAISQGLGYLEYYGTKLPAKLKWITDGLSKTILVSEVAGFPELVAGNESIQTTWYSPWVIADSVWVHSPLATRRDANLSPLDIQYLERPVNFSNVGQIFSFHPSGAHVSMCDGSVRFLSEESSPATVFALASRSNGNAIESSE